VRRQDSSGGGWRRLVIAMFAVLSLAAASDPAERLPDPAQEARARDLFQQVRCLVCQNESIDDSQAELAQDLRKVVREQIIAGRSDDQIRAFLVARYGEFVLLKPSFNGANVALWLGPFAVLLAGGLFLLLRVRKKPRTPPLSAEEEARLAELTGDRRV
jgi:cytochrome c-type biogenesis protein CcmH